MNLTMVGVPPCVVMSIGIMSALSGAQLATGSTRTLQHQGNTTHQNTHKTARLTTNCRVRQDRLRTAKEKGSKHDEFWCWNREYIQGAVNLFDVSAETGQSLDRDCLQYLVLYIILQL